MNEYAILAGVLIAVLVYSIRDGLLIWFAFRWTVGRPVSPSVPAPGTGTPPPVVIPPPVVVPPPVVAPSPRFTGITATSFGGAGDSNASAYGGMVNPNNPGVALPFHFTGTRPTVRVFYGGKSVDCPIVDVGPWNINDPYWQTGTRPQAESGTDTTGRSTNLAGIDLTPAAWIALGVSNPNSVKTKVNWDFVGVLDAPSTGTTPTTPTPVTPTGTPAWITLGRTFDGLVWNSGPMPPQIAAWLDHVAAVFPEMAPYCKALKAAGASNWFAWCGFFVQAMLAYSNIRGPMSAAGLQGNTTTGDWAYVDAWRTWGTKVWDAVDGGSIDDAQPQVGDVLIWYVPNIIHHVSFYNEPEPDTEDFNSLGGDQGKPLRVCIEDISMSYCVAIRRPPAPGASA